MKRASRAVWLYLGVLASLGAGAACGDDDAAIASGNAGQAGATTMPAARRAGAFPDPCELLDAPLASSLIGAALRVMPTIPDRSCNYESGDRSVSIIVSEGEGGLDAVREFAEPAAGLGDEAYKTIAGRLVQFDFIAKGYSVTLSASDAEEADMRAAAETIVERL